MIQAEAYINGLADAGIDTSKMYIQVHKDRYVSTGHVYSIYDDALTQDALDQNDLNQAQCATNKQEGNTNDHQ